MNFGERKNVFRTHKSFVVCMKLHMYINTLRMPVAYIFLVNWSSLFQVMIYCLTQWWLSVNRAPRNIVYWIWNENLKNNYGNRTGRSFFLQISVFKYQNPRLLNNGVFISLCLSIPTSYISVTILRVKYSISSLYEYFSVFLFMWQNLDHLDVSRLRTQHIGLVSLDWQVFKQNPICILLSNTPSDMFT